MTVTLLALLASAVVPPASAIAESDPPGGPAVETFTLANGMQVVVIPDHRAPVVTHMVWYKVGSADEPPGKSGIAHFFEHLMFKGTKNHAAGEFSAKIAEIGGSENAFTTYDYTAYHQTVASGSLGTMMSYEADRMRNLVLSDGVIATERDVVLEERRSRIETSPQALLGEELNATLYQNQPYRIPVIGWMHEMEQLNLADAIAFYEKYYRPNNAVLVVAGDVEPQEVRRLADASYGMLERGPDLPPRMRPSEPEQNTMRTVTMRDRRIGVPAFRRAWLAPSFLTAPKGESEALELLSEILGGGTRSRIYQRLVVDTGLASSAGAGYSGSALDDTSFSVYGAPRGGATLEAVEAAIYSEVEKVAAEGITEDELARAKQRYLRAEIFSRDSAGRLANIYGAALATGATVESVQTWPERLQAVTADEVRAVAAKYLDPSRSVTGYMLPADPAAN
ncbi:MAG: M16 family metallopeptidase [Rhizobiaceae bacterium]